MTKELLGLGISFSVAERQGWQSKFYVMVVLQD